MTERVRDGALEHPTDRARTSGGCERGGHPLTASWRVFGNSKYWYKDEELSDSHLNEAIGL
jgi:hypothetical protein